MSVINYFTWRGAVIKSSLQATTKLVLHTLGCHMNDSGESCFPSIELLCEETSLSNRVVILHLKLSEEAGFITKSKHGFGGKKWARNEYKATFPELKIEQNLEEKSTDCSQENTDKVVTQSHYLDNEGSDFKDIKAVTQSHTNYPYNYPVVFPTDVEKTTPRESEKNISENPPMRPEGLLACRLIKLNVAVTSMHPVLCKWVTDNIPIDFIEQCISLARQNKPWPEKIAAGYLDAIIRNELKPKSDNSWVMTDEGTMAKGREVGLQARAGESMADYRSRLKHAVGIGRCANE